MMDGFWNYAQDIFGGRPDYIGRFCDRVEIPADKTKCWEWIGPKHTAGYGRFPIKRKYMLAHRLLYECVHGPKSIPEKYHLDHLCRNRGCVNPAHLEPVTARENVLRGIGACARNLRKSHCKRGHPLDGDNVYRLQGKWRACKTCVRENSKRRHAQKKVAKHSAGTTL